MIHYINAIYFYHTFFDSLVYIALNDRSVMHIKMK
jgi:hypothetical protein